MRQLGAVRAVVVGSVLLVTVCVLSSSCGGPAEEGGIPAGPHPVIVVAVDGLRADALGCYGSPGARTPSFDSLADEAVRFEWAFAQAADAAVSFASLLTGLYPTTSGVRVSGDRLPDEAVTLAETLGESGITSAAFVEGVPSGDDFGLAQGFATYDLSAEPGAAARRWLEERGSDEAVLIIRGWSVGSPFEEGGAAGPTAPEGFTERLQRALLQPEDVDELLLTPEDLDYARALYADRIRVLDDRLGDFMAELRKAGRLEEATLVVLGTNGADLARHGASGRQSLHTTMTRVPLFIRFPGAVTGQSVTRMVELVDVLPTLSEIQGVAVPTAIQGRSLLPLIRGEGTPPYLAFSESQALGGQRAIALGGYRLLERGEAPPKLYDLAADPLELETIAEDDPERVAVLERHLEAWQKMVSVASLDPELRSDEPLDDETLERLKSLGYIQ